MDTDFNQRTNPAGAYDIESLINEVEWNIIEEG